MWCWINCLPHAKTSPFHRRQQLLSCWAICDMCYVVAWCGITVLQPVGCLGKQTKVPLFIQSLERPDVTAASVCFDLR